MSRFLLVLSLLVTIALSSYCQTRTWEKLKGPYGTKIEYLRVHNNGAYYVTAVVDDGRRLLKSTDQGKTWAKLPQLPQGLDTSSITTPSDYLFSIYSLELGTDSAVYLRYQYPNQQSNENRTSAIYITTNDGQDWKKIYDSALTLSVTGKPGECMVAVQDTFYRGLKRINNDGAFIDSPYLPYRQYYWVSDSTYISHESLISISHDNCKTWSLYDFPPLGNKVKVIEYITRGPNNVFYINCLDNVSTRRIYKGNFSGGWTQLGDPPAYLGRISALSNDRIIGFDSYWPQIYSLYILNTDWPVMTKSKSMPIPPDGITDQMFTTDLLDGIIYPTYDGIFRSSDFGLTWEEFPIPYSDVTSIHVNGAGHIFTKKGSTSNLPMNQVKSYVSMSTDAGQTWTKTSPQFRAPYGYIGPGFDGGTILTVNDTIGKGMDIWYMGTESNSEWKKLARTIDLSKDSTVKEGVGIAYFTLIDSLENIFLGDRSVFKSEDKGTSWDSEITQPPLGISLACFSPTWKLYGLGSSGRKTTMSPDLGKTWKPVYYNKAFMNGSIVSVCAPTDSTIFAGNNVEGVSVSFDHGRNWKALKGPWGDSITCLAYTKNNEVFIGTRNKGLFSCDYKGLNPRQEPLNIPFNRVLSLYVDKGKDVYIGTQGTGVWKSVGTLPASVHDKVRSNEYQAEVVHSANGNISLRLTLNVPMTFDITLYDALGKELRSLPNKSFSNGTYIIPFDMMNTPAGSYFIRLRNKDTEQVLKFQH